MIQVITFDRRSMASFFRRFPAGEALALGIPDFPKAGLILKDFVTKVWVERCRTNLLGLKSPDLVLKHLFNGSFIRAFALARTIFYKNRWQLLRKLERNVLNPNWETDLSDGGPGGIKDFHRECQIYLGCSGHQWMMRRRAQLATLWLRMGKPPEAVAHRLGFSSLWQFKCVLSAVTGVNWAAVLELPPLDDLEPGELLEQLRPVWWPAPRPWSTKLNPLVEISASRSNFWDAEFELVPRPKASVRPMEIISALDEGFRAMNSSGAEILVPIFDELRPGPRDILGPSPATRKAA